MPKGYKKTDKYSYSTKYYFKILFQNISFQAFTKTYFLTLICITFNNFVL